MIRPITRPRVLSVRRAQPQGCSPGDEVVVRLEPGLQALLHLRDAEGRRLGEGLASEWWLGLGAAATAANRAGGEARGWTGVSFSVQWTRPAAETETLLARSVVERALPRRFGKTALVHRYEVTSEGTGELLAKGAMVLASAHIDPSAGAARPPAPVLAAGPPASPPPSQGLKARLRDALDAVLPPPLAGAVRRAYRHAVHRSESKAIVPLQWLAVPARLELGKLASFEVQVTNPGTLPEELEAVLEPPFGFGLEGAWTGPSRVRVKRGHLARLAGTVRGLRPDEVNLGEPWMLTCILKAGGRELARIEASIAVADPAPARIFYVLTEDCETFDGGDSTGRYGAARVLGNANGFMDPEEYRFQMIEKPRALNRIADKHGARWTHFWTTTQLAAARWACARSQTGAWDRIVSGLEASVRDGSRRHEYAPHIHFDFEPDSALPPQPRLRYDPATDGLLPEEYYDPILNADHKFHGWDGARKGIAYVKEEGDFSRADSKVGSLRAATRLLARLAHAAGGGQALVTRTGACDFGASPEDLEASFRALEANGILADADAGLYEQVGEHPRRRQIYFCRRSDLEKEIEHLRQAGVVQVRAPEVQLEGADLQTLNAWFERRVAESQGAGVRAIVAMTHAMFMKGEPDPFRNVAGGDFEKLDHHLEYARRTHPEVAFATASEAVLEFLDYYSPTLRAVVIQPRFRSLDGRTVLYPIRILGRGIPVSPERPMRVVVTAPAAFDPSELERLTVLEHGTVVASATPDANALSRVEFVARETKGYELEVKAAAGLPWDVRVAGLPHLASEAGEEMGDDPEQDLLRLDAPDLIRANVAREGELTAGDNWEWALPAEPFRLLAHPVAGGTEPLGRRIHPYGFYPLGVALHAALGLCSGARPLEADVRWRRPMTGRTTFRLRCRLARVDASQVVVESRFFEAAVECAEMRVTLARPPVAVDGE